VTDRQLILEISEPGEPSQQITLSGSLVVGRDCDGLQVRDPLTSRQHLRLTLTDEGLTVEDLGSRNGTFVNGEALHAPSPLHVGDVIMLGATELRVLGPAGASIDGYETIGSDPVVVRYAPGSSAERSARGVLTAALRAYRRLAGLRSDDSASRIEINLVDPFPDPAQPAELMTEGTLVDAPHARVWMVVTADSPAEAPHRALALVLGAELPAWDGLELLLEGYGLHTAGGSDSREMLSRAADSTLATAPDAIRPSLARSFVRYLIAQSDEAAFLRMLKTATPGNVDAAAREIYGASLAQLEDAWRRSLTDMPRVRMRDFARLATRYLRPYAWREAEMFVYMLLALAFGLTFPFIFKRLLDVALPAGHLSAALGLLGILAGAFAISLVAGVRRSLLAAKISSSLVRQLRVDMFRRLQQLSLDWFDQHGQGDVLARFFSDVSLLEAGLTQTLRDGATQALTLISFAVVLITLNPLLAAITLAATPIVALLYRLMSTETQRRSVAVQEQTSAALSVSTENYAAQQVVQAFGLARREVARFTAVSDLLVRRQVRLQIYGGLFSVTVNGFVMALRIIILGVGTWLVLHHHLTVGGLVAFLSVMDSVIAPVTTLSNIGQLFQSATGALARVNEVMDAQPSIVDRDDAQPLAPLQTEIRLDAVGFGYTPERRVLDQADAVIEAGTRVAFVGASGSGKSTILRLLLRVGDPDEGALTYDGLDLRDCTLDSLRERIGVVFQDTFLFTGTIRENIALARPGASTEEVEAAARAAELDDVVAAFPQGYDTPVGERGGRLSGGERQRVAIARAILRDPSVLLLDEATSALDPRTERRVMDTLRRAGEGRTTIAVSHRLRTVVDYDSIFVVSAGRLVEHGTHASLLAAGGTYTELWNEQEAGATAVPFASEALTALRSLPLFASVGDDELGRLVSSADAVEVAAGERFTAPPGTLALLRSGGGELIVEDDSGDEIIAGELGPWDALGLSALLGSERRRMLRASMATTLSIIDDPALGHLASLSAASGAARPLPPDTPDGGRGLSRLSMTGAWLSDDDDTSSSAKWSASTPSLTP